MKNVSLVIMIISLIFMFGSIEFYGCADDDDDNTSGTSVTATPNEETPTSTPMFTPTATTTPKEGMGILNIWTSPVPGDIYVDGQWKGWEVWQGKLPVGSYTVSFGEVEGHSTPEQVVADVIANETTHIEGVYVITFIKTYGGNLPDYGCSVHQTSDGGFIFTGFADYEVMDDCPYVYLAKTDSYGNEVWSKKFGYGYGRSVQQTSDGGLIVVGTYFCHLLSSDVYLIKTDNNGNELWSRKIDRNPSDSGNSVQQTSDGGFIITGYTSDNGYDYDVFLIKTDNSGNEIWSKTFGGNESEFGYSVQKTSDGGYIIVGETGSFGAGSIDVYLIKTDSNGNELWSKTFGESGSDSGYSVQQTSDGGFIITGYTSSFGTGGDVYLIKTDSNGNEQWFRTIGGNAWDEGKSVRQTSDGGYIISGFTSSFGASNHVYLIKTDGNGNTIWSRGLIGDTFSWGFSWIGSSVQQTSDGGYVISSGVSTSPWWDVLLIKTDQNGNV